MPTLKRKPKIHIKKRNGKNTQRVYRGGELGVLNQATAQELFNVSGGKMKTLLETTEYKPEEHDGFRVLALNEAKRKQIQIDKYYPSLANISGEITNKDKEDYFLYLLNDDTQGGNTKKLDIKKLDIKKLHADMRGDNLKKALANIRLMIYNMEIEARGANLEKLENDIVHIFCALDSRTSGAEAATEAAAALAPANTAATAARPVAATGAVPGAQTVNGEASGPSI